VKFLLSDSLLVHRLSCSLREDYVRLVVQNQTDQNRDMIQRLIEIRSDVAVYHSIRKKLDHEDQIYRALHVTCFSDNDVD
jgi:ABC-type metal ion transport system substrate-binding protein